MAQRVNEELLTNEIFDFDTHLSSNDTLGSNLFSQDTICIYLSFNLSFTDSVKTPRKYNKLNERTELSLFEKKSNITSWSFYFKNDKSFSAFSVRKNPKCYDFKREMVIKNCSESIFIIYEYYNNPLLKWSIERNRLILVINEVSYTALNKRFKKDKLLLVRS